jgi:hypothetical protein
MPFYDTIPPTFSRACRRVGIRPTRWVLMVNVRDQSMALWEKGTEPSPWPIFPRYRLRRRYVISTSKVGIGQVADSWRTPAGLHRIARKIGGGWPLGTVFKHRRPIAVVREGIMVVHRILWLEGLEPGWNRGGEVDSFRRYIYLHGIGDELTLGRPASAGCVHLALADIAPLYELVPIGTLVWIA